VIHHAVVQGSEEWLRLRLGIPTASEFSRIITPKKWDLAAGRAQYRVELLTEMILGGPLDGVTTPAMLHGKDWEPKARAAYEMQEGVDVEDCGFCTDDARTYGASPDAFVGDDGSLEIKCPEKPEIHVGYLLNPDSFSESHWVQVQGQLFVTGRKWTDLISYFMGIPMVRVRITPHEEFQAKLAAHLRTFLTELDSLKAVAIERGCKFHEDKPAPPAPDLIRDMTTHADIEEMVASGAIVPWRVPCPLCSKMEGYGEAPGGVCPRCGGERTVEAIVPEGRA
jgi:hypothetical protein